jgi:anthranilate/para-aminobenzoate synthase component II
MPIDLRNQWTQNTKFILEYAMNQNNNGNSYPIWATCLGHEAVSYITSLNSDNMTTLTEVHGQDGSTRKLIMKTNSSILFDNMPQNVMK